METGDLGPFGRVVWLAVKRMRNVECAIALFCLDRAGDG